MWFPNPKIESEKAALQGADEATAFVALRWHEFFDVHSPDSFQPRVSNIPSLISEIKDVAFRCRTNGAWCNHIPLLIEEIKNRYHSCSGLINNSRHKHLIEGVIKSNHFEEIYKLTNQLEGDNFSEDWTLGICRKLVEDLPRWLPRNKSDADMLLNHAATIATQKLSFDKDNDEFISSLKNDIHSISNDIKCQIEAVPKEVECVVGIIVKGGEKRFRQIRSVLRKSGIEFVRRIDLPQHQEFELIEADTQFLFPCIKVHAPSARGALVQAIQKIKNALALLSFYSHDAVAEIINYACIKSNGSFTISNLGFDYKNKLKPRHNSEKLALEASQVINSGCAAPVLNALELYSMAARERDTRGAFLNLWSALECLAKNKGSVIKSVTSLVIPITNWRIVDKIVRYLAISTHLWRGIKGQFNITALPHSTEKFVAAEDLLQVFMMKDNHPWLREMTTLATGHPLLRHRFKVAWDLLKRPGHLKQELQLSRSRLNWHIWRIYRARNLLVHDGVESPLLPRLFDHLHYYVSIVLSRIIHGLSVASKWNWEDSAEHWIFRGNYLLEELDKNPLDLQIDDFIVRPERIIKRRPYKFANDEQTNIQNQKFPDYFI